MGMLTLILCVLICFLIISALLWVVTDAACTRVLDWIEPSEHVIEQPEEKLDRIPPEIKGIQDYLIYQGDTISYFTGVSVSDNEDPSPTLEVDSMDVNLTLPGIYSATYVATDASGNSVQETAQVTVLPKQEGYAELQQIYELADELLEIILEGTSNTQQQVEAIYNWARNDIRYAGHSDREDWRQTAYDVIHLGEGDCYGYFAVTKLMFDRLGIPNIDVQKVRNHEEDSDHFWSLVSIDGGSTYYHFDATPRYGDGDDFCLVTDAFLDAYSENHKHSHNRDRSLYPQTPKEAL